MSGPLLALAVVFASLAAPHTLSATASAAPARAEGEAPPAEEGPPKGPLAGLTYRLLGPANGGRVSQAAGVPGDPLTYYAASAAGGVWKSSDGGHAWVPVFDQQPVSSIGSLAVAPSDPNVVWVGTGEANIRGNVGEGNGIYRSTDAGRTWSHLLAFEGQVGALAVHPREPDLAWAAVLGSPFGPTRERGVYRTGDGGRTWRRVLFVDEDTGASDVTLDPGNPRVLFAGTWQTRRRPWGFSSGGPGSGLWVSHDGGDSWRRLRDGGLPAAPWGKVNVRVAPADPRRVYALIEAKEGGLFRSDDGGESWRRVNDSGGLRQRAWYFNTLTVDPRQPDVVWFPQVPMLKTLDGGESVRAVKGGGWDYHDLWIDPLDPRRMIAASDAGVSLSADGGATWRRPPLPVGQLYRLSTDSRQPYRVLASLQDWGTISGPSNSLHSGGVLLSDWHSVGGGEAGHVVAEPADPDLVWAGEYLGTVTRWDGRTGQSPHVGIYPDNGSGHGAVALRHRFQWTAPIVASRHLPGVVYHAAEVVFRTADGGQSWQAVSPDLTRNDASKQQWSGGPLTGDNTGVEYYGTVFALAESPRDPQVLWAGSDDGLVHVTRDGGASWQRVTPPGVPEWATIANIEASPFDAGTAWVVADAHRLDDERPYLWVTEDYGRSWRSLASGLDPEVYLHVVRADPARRGLLYLGSERGVMASWDGGGRWQPLRLNLPTVSVIDLAVAADDLVVGTLGRAIWVLDDLAPLRAWEDSVRERALHLFPPRPAVRWRWRDAPFGDDAGAGANPPAGALLTYWLREAAAEPVTLEVLDAEGRVVRTLRSELEPGPIGPHHPDWDPWSDPQPALADEAGLHRATWDLAADGAPYLPGAMVDTGDPHDGPLVAPGDYTLRLTANGVSATQPLRVLPDPRTAVDATSRQAIAGFQRSLVERIGEIVTLVERLRRVREQVVARHALLAGDARAAELLAAGEALVARLDAIESALHNPEARVTYDILAGRQGGTKLHSRYAWLLEATRDQDLPPTQGMREVAATLDAELATQRDALRATLETDLAQLEELATRLDLGHVVVPK